MARGPKNGLTATQERDFPPKIAFLSVRNAISGPARPFWHVPCVKI